MADTPSKGNRSKVLFIISVVLVGAGMLTPAMAHTGFMEDIYLSLPVSVVIAVVSGAVIGVLFSRIFQSTSGMMVVNAIIGVVYGLSTFFAIYGYIFWREIFYRIEMVVPLLVGGIPTVLLVIIKNKITAGGSEAAPDA